VVFRRQVADTVLHFILAVVDPFDQNFYAVDSEGELLQFEHSSFAHTSLTG